MRRAWHVLFFAAGWTGLLLAGFAGLDGLARPAQDAKLQLTESEQREILGAVKLFNEIWADFYATGGIPSMIDAMPATKLVKHGIFRDTGFLLENGKYQVYDLARMVPVELTASAPDRAEVLVWEEWNFAFQDRTTRALLSPVRGMGQGFRYHLERGAGRWAIYGWTPEDIPAPAKEEFAW